MATRSGSIYQRADGYWCAALSHNGKRKVIYAPTEKDAKGKLAELQRSLGAAGAIPTPGRRTVSDVLDAFLEMKRNRLRPRTLSDYEGAARRYLRPALGSVRLNALSPEQIHRCYADLARQGVTRQAQMAHAVLSGALNLAVRFGWLAFNPCERVDRPAWRAPRREVWTPDDLRRFVDDAADYWRFPLWLVGIFSGCRPGELLALRWADVDLDAGALTVRRSGQRIGGTWVEGAPKTWAGERTISLPEAAIDALRRQHRQQAVWRLAAGPEWHDAGLVFSSHTGAPLDGPNTARALRLLCRRLDLPALTPHQLRHLSASLLLKAGLPIPDVSARLGHATPAITMQVYAHILDRNDRHAAVALARAVGGTG